MNQGLLSAGWAEPGHAPGGCTGEHEAPQPPLEQARCHSPTGESPGKGKQTQETRNTPSAGRGCLFQSCFPTQSSASPGRRNKTASDLTHPQETPAAPSHLCQQPPDGSPRLSPSSPTPRGAGSPPSPPGRVQPPPRHPPGEIGPVPPAVRHRGFTSLREPPKPALASRPRRRRTHGDLRCSGREGLPARLFPCAPLPCLQPVYHHAASHGLLSTLTEARL